MIAETTDSTVPPEEGSLLLGIILCWLLNVVHLGVAYILFASSDRLLPAVFVLVGGIGLLQVGYIAPIWYVLWRRGKKRMATGLAIAAGITLLFNGMFWVLLVVNGLVKL